MSVIVAAPPKMTHNKFLFVALLNFTHARLSYPVDKGGEGGGEGDIWQTIIYYTERCTNEASAICLAGIGHIKHIVPTLFLAFFYCLCMCDNYNCACRGLSVCAGAWHVGYSLTTAAEKGKFINYLI